MCKSTRGTIPACALLELIARTVHAQHAMQHEVNKQVNQAAEFGETSKRDLRRIAVGYVVSIPRLQTDKILQDSNEQVRKPHRRL